MEYEIPEVVLGKLDYLVMILYMAGLLGMGLYYRKFAQQGLENYFLAGRKLPGADIGRALLRICFLRRLWGLPWHKHPA